MRFYAIAVGAMLWVGATGSSMAQTMFEQCERQKTTVVTLEKQSQSLDLDTTLTNNQLMELQRQENELRLKQRLQTTQKIELQKKIRMETSERERLCSIIQQCEGHERAADLLKQRIAPQEDLLRKIRQEIQGRSAESNRLSGEVDRVSEKYQSLNCDNLVPGQTPQATIDLCSDLFSQWNKLQAETNQLDSSIAGLQSSYQKVMQDMRASKAELDRLLGGMRGSCGHSSRLAELEAIEREQSGYNSMQDDFARIFSSVKRFRALKVLKPTLKPAEPAPEPKKGKPRLRVVR